MDTMPAPTTNPMGGEVFVITEKTFSTIKGKSVLNTVRVGKPEGFAPPQEVKNMGIFYNKK